MVKGICTLSLDYWETKQRRRRQIHERERMHPSRVVESRWQRVNGTTIHSTNDDENSEMLTRIERCVPSHHSISSSNSNNRHPTFNIQRRINQNKRVVQCSICMNDRRHSSAAKNCGHVFCWDCLQHWIATVRPECPLCRVPTTSKDVIALYDYSP